MPPLAELLGESPGIQAVQETVGRLLARGADGRRLPTILIQGETGTGKGLCAGMTCLAARRIDEAWSHAQEALALSRRLGARGSEADALCLAGDVASADRADDAERYYREALVLASQLRMRPIVAHCHLGLGSLYRRAGKSEQVLEHLTTATMMYREMGMDFWLEKAEAALEGIG